MYGVDSPHDFADWLLGEHDIATYWPDDLERPDDVTKHPQGQTYIDLEGKSANLALFTIDKAESCGLRPDVSGSRVAVFEPRPTCAEDGCYANSKGSKPHRDLCTTHAAERKRERMRQGRPPRRGVDY